MPLHTPGELDGFVNPRDLSQCGQDSGRQFLDRCLHFGGEYLEAFPDAARGHHGLGSITAVAALRAQLAEARGSGPLALTVLAEKAEAPEPGG